MSLIRNLPHRALVQTPTDTRDAIGGVVQTFATFVASLPCWIQPVGATDTVDRGTHAQERRLKMFTDGTFDIPMDARIVYDGRTFEILGAWRPGEFGRPDLDHRQYDLLEIIKS